MPLFVCSKCKCIENTALGFYWGRKTEGKPVLCSKCETGKWHNRFKKVEFDSSKWEYDSTGEFVGSKNSLNKQYDHFHPTKR